MDAVLFVTPEYNRSIPGALKNAIDWASRPWGAELIRPHPRRDHRGIPGNIGTAVAQQSLRAVLAFCNARQMTAPEAYIQFSATVFTDDGEVKDESTQEFLSNYMAEVPRARRPCVDSSAPGRRCPPRLAAAQSVVTGDGFGTAVYAMNAGQRTNPADQSVASALADLALAAAHEPVPRRSGRCSPAERSPPGSSPEVMTW